MVPKKHGSPERGMLSLCSSIPVLPSPRTPHEPLRAFAVPYALSSRATKITRAWLPAHGFSLPTLSTNPPPSPPFTPKTTTITHAPDTQD